MQINKMLVQVGIRILIFLLFLIGIFVEIPFFPYLIIVLLLANIVFMFINKTRGIVGTVLLALLIPGLFIFLLEYILTIVGAFISFVYALVFALKYFRGDFKAERKSLKKVVKKK